MSRSDRGVAQRYAARKRKKRAGVSRISPATSLPVAVAEEAAAPEAAAEPTAPVPPTAPRQSTVAGRQVPIVRMATPVRRSFASYADEYRYIAGDLKRVALVAGGLLLVLIVLSLFIR
jgi:hypothetical protein